MIPSSAKNKRHKMTATELNIIKRDVLIVVYKDTYI
jgi:hypothetical protein